MNSKSFTCLYSNMKIIVKYTVNAFPLPLRTYCSRPCWLGLCPSLCVSTGLFLSLCQQIGQWFIDQHSEIYFYLIVFKYFCPYMKILFFFLVYQCSQPPISPRIFMWIFQFLTLTNSDAFDICVHYLCKGTAGYLFSEEELFTVNLIKIAKILPKCPLYIGHAFANAG